MSRPEIDLDDPVKSSDSAASNSADDLLAQLAGDEVDRMLSEADAAAPETHNVDRPVPETIPPVASAPVHPEFYTPPDAAQRNPNAVLEATEAALDDLLDEADAAKTASSMPESSHAPAASTQSIEDVITQRAQDLISQARIEEGGDLPAPAFDSTGEPLSAADALAAEMEADERAHLDALMRMKATGAPPQAPEAPTEPALPPSAPEIDEDKVDFSPPSRADRTPLLVRILEWINAPLAGLSDNVRAAIGKVAIVTMLNAVGVFLYVILFRHH